MLRRYLVAASALVAGLTLAVAMPATADTSSGPAEVIGTITSGASPRSIVTASDGTAYVADAGLGGITVIRNGAATTTAYGTTPFDLALSPDQTTLYVVDTAFPADTLTALDASTLAPIWSVSVPSGASSLAISPDGSTLYVPTAFSYDAYSSSDGSLLWSDFGGVGDVVATPDGSYVFVSSDTSNAVYQIPTATPGVVITRGGYTGARGVAASPDGSLLYVGDANGSGSVDVLDIASVTSVASFALGFDPSRIAVSPDGSVLLATDTADDLVAVVDTATGAVTQTLPTDTSPLGVTFAQDGRRAFVANSDSDTVTELSWPSLAVTPASITTTVGTAVSAQLTASDFAGAVSFGATSLPAGLTLDPASGLISGIPTTTAPLTSYDVSATDGTATVHQTVGVTVSADSPALAATGVDARGPLVVGGAVILGGVVIVVGAALRRRSMPRAAGRGRR